ncbi:Protein fmp52, mitochondrial [Mycoblastus sanguinarius]|nr:Protein fmp52, mitochondrial [Mycoblastus sanguinarius]
MAENKVSAALVGCTGLVVYFAGSEGSHLLTTLVSLSSHPTVHALARRNLPTTASNLRPLTEADSSEWPASFKSLSPAPNIFLSALGTTRGQAGSFEAQRKIDYDLNLSLAKAAKDAGVKTYVLISSGGVSKSSLFSYSRMKGELEEAVTELNFPHTIILKPLLLMGKREESRPPEAMLQGIAKGLGMINKRLLTDWWTTDADVVARAAVNAGMQCAEGKKEEGLWMIGQSEILKLGAENF